MSTSSGFEAPLDGACKQCLRRSWLLAELSGPLDFLATDRGRLLDLLALEDEELLKAAGGRRRTELKARYDSFDRRELQIGACVQALCRHERRFPRSLRTAAAPRMLHVDGGTSQLAQLTAAPVVAIAGGRRASDYGIEIAGSLARGLAASGVTVTGGLADGIPAAVHAGALEAHAGTLAVMPGGLGVSAPARRRPLYERIGKRGCAVAELPWDCSGRRWGRVASERIVARLAQLIIVVEAADRPDELALARLARSLGRTVAAVPGRVTSPLSRGSNRLLMEGASLVRGPGDALELLYPVNGARSAPAATASPRRMLPARLESVLAQVAAGLDTPAKLCGRVADTENVLLALSELELMGLLGRGDGGRYVPRDPFPPS